MLSWNCKETQATGLRLWEKSRKWREIFPKHESLANFFSEELKKKNSGLLYLELDGEVVGYVMYSWPSSLFASITKLAGFGCTPFLLYTVLLLKHFISTNSLYFTRNKKLAEEVLIALYCFILVKLLPLICYSVKF